MKRSEVFLSVIVRVRNAALFIGPALHRLIGVMEENFRFYEIVLVDDASTDATRSIINDIQQQERNIQLYILAQSRGDNIAVTVGLDHAIGDLIVILDLKVDPPDLIPAMVGLAVQGTEIVYGLPRERLQSQGLYNRLFGWLVYAMGRINNIDVPQAVSGYRLISRTVLNFMLEAPDRHRTLMLLPAISGYRHATIKYDRLISQRDGPPTRKRQTFIKALDLVFSASPRPLLRVSTLMSLGISGISFVYSILVVLIGIFKQDVAPGWVSLSLQISGLFFLTCIVLAMLSEYLLQVLEMTKGGPRYHIAYQGHSSRLSLANKLNIVDTGETQPIRTAALPEDDAAST
jgi:glycosyltransferase involved in cell wall biosynthesis